MAFSRSFVRRSGRSPRGRSGWSPNFAARPLSPSRIRGCSTNCASRCNSRPPPPTCSRSSAARPSICRPVLDTLTELAARLCDADMAPASCDGTGHLHCSRPSYRFPQAVRRSRVARPRQDEDASPAGRARRESGRLHIPDVKPIRILRRVRRRTANCGASEPDWASRYCAKAPPSASSSLMRNKPAALHRQADRAGDYFRRPGGDRHRERAAVRGEQQRTANWRNRWNSRPRPPTCSRLSAARLSICRRCLIRWSNRRLGSARADRISFTTRGEGLQLGRALVNMNSRTFRRIRFASTAVRAGRAALEHKPIHIHDVLAIRTTSQEHTDDWKISGRLLGYRYS